MIQGKGEMVVSPSQTRSGVCDDSVELLRIVSKKPHHVSRRPEWSLCVRPPKVDSLTECLRGLADSLGARLGILGAQRLRECDH